jgi:phosphopantetheinyl transferase
MKEEAEEKRQFEEDRFMRLVSRLLFVLLKTMLLIYYNILFCFRM